MSNLMDHARNELELCGQFREDPAFATSILAAVAAFASYPGHSGGSAMAGIQMLGDLLSFKNLSPLTNNPDEWIKHTPDMWDGEHHVWQNRRNGEAFSTDGGETYRLMSEDGKKGRKGPVHKSLITHVCHWEPVGQSSSAMVNESAYERAAEAVAEEGDSVDTVLCACGTRYRADEFRAHCEINGTRHHYESAEDRG